MPPQWRQSIPPLKHLCFRGHLVRRRIIRRYLQHNPTAKVEIGSGQLPVTQPGWLSADLYTGDIYLDAKKPLPFPDNSLSYLFSEHFLEHLRFEDASRFLREAYRVLKPGGVIRTAVPDLYSICQTYCQWDSQIQQQVTKSYKEVFSMDTVAQKRTKFFAAEHMNINFYVFDHACMYDFELLEEAHKAVGFQQITRCEYGNSADPELTHLERHAEIDASAVESTLISEAVKPPVAQKSTAHELDELFARFQKELD